jgi:glutamine synthetase
VGTLAPSHNSPQSVHSGTHEGWCRFRRLRRGAKVGQGRRHGAGTRVVTGFADPFWDAPTLSFICTTLEADTKASFPDDPRNIARRAEEYLVESGIADRSQWGPEFEFYVFDSVSYENEMNRAGYSVESGEAGWRSGAGGHGHYIPLHGGYHAMPPRTRFTTCAPR